MSALSKALPLKRKPAESSKPPSKPKTALEPGNPLGVYSSPKSFMLPGVPRTCSVSCRSVLFVSRVHGTASTRHARGSPAFCTSPRCFSVSLLRTSVCIGARRFGSGTFLSVFLESLPGIRNVTIFAPVLPYGYFFVVHQYAMFVATARICACVAMHPPTVCLDFVSSHIRFDFVLASPSRFLHVRNLGIRPLFLGLRCLPMRTYCCCIFILQVFTSGPLL